MRLLPLLATVLLLAGCNDYRVPPTDRLAAQQDHTPRTFKVVAVHDLLTEGVGRADPRASHLIEVDVIEGPDAGKQLTLPYDSWILGSKPPPAEGSVVTCAPADWVTRPEQVKGRGE